MKCLKVKRKRKRKVKEITVKKLRNGSLYFNTKTKQVERMLGTLNSNRVWTTAHEKPANTARCIHLRYATQGEVDGYLGASKRKLKGLMRFLPPLPVTQ